MGIIVGILIVRPLKQRGFINHGSTLGMFAAKIYWGQVSGFVVCLFRLRRGFLRKRAKRSAGIPGFLGDSRLEYMILKI